MRKFMLSAFGVACLCSGALLQADEPAKPADAPPERPRFNREEFMKKYDKNMDGKLDEAERAAARADAPARPQGEPGRGPGRPEGERGRGPGFGLNREEMMKKYDKDANGELDDKEREAMRADFEKAREEREAEFKKTFDKDADGKLNAEEEAAYNKAVEERRARFGNRRPGEGRPGDGEGRRRGDRPRENTEEKKPE